jgi:GTP-binding protein SAR1
LTMGNTRFKAFDLGGHPAARKAWKNYYPSVQGIFYLVDVSDSDRFEESKEELKDILAISEEKKIPIAILGNKIDKKGAISGEELKKNFDLQSQLNSKDCLVQIFMCSIALKSGYGEAFQWIDSLLK